MDSYVTRQMSFSPLEQMYLASCDCLPDYPHLAMTMEWKQKLLVTSKAGKPEIIPTADLLLPFPTLAYLISSEGLGHIRGFQDYFEGMDAKSHNGRLHEIARSAIENHVLPKETKESIMRHASICSVLIASTDGMVWSPHGINRDTLDDLFGVSPSPGYVIIHGRTEKGAIIIREADRDAISRLKGISYLWSEEYHR